MNHFFRRIIETFAVILLTLSAISSKPLTGHPLARERESESGDRVPRTANRFRPRRIAEPWNGFTCVIGSPRFPRRNTQGGGEGRQRASLPVISAYARLSFHAPSFAPAPGRAADSSSGTARHNEGKRRRERERAREGKDR